MSRPQLADSRSGRPRVAGFEGETFGTAGVRRAQPQPGDGAPPVSPPERGDDGHALVYGLARRGWTPANISRWSDSRPQARVSQPEFRNRIWACSTRPANFRRELFTSEPVGDQVDPEERRSSAAASASPPWPSGPLKAPPVASNTCGMCHQDHRRLFEAPRPSVFGRLAVLAAGLRARRDSLRRTRTPVAPNGNLPASDLQTISANCQIWKPAAPKPPEHDQRCPQLRRRVDARELLSHLRPTSDRAQLLVQLGPMPVRGRAGHKRAWTGKGRGLRRSEWRAHVLLRWLSMAYSKCAHVLPSSIQRGLSQPESAPEPWHWEWVC